jgi:hypothetical protein
MLKEQWVALGSRGRNSDVYKPTTLECQHEYQVLLDPVNETSGATVELGLLSRSGPAADAAPATDLEIGRVLRGRYVVQERLGCGGRGTVFRALDLYRSSLPAAEQYVAMKVLHAGRD